MEAYAEQHNFPIVGPVVGQRCYQVARMIGARDIFELGSGFGYPTAWFAQAVLENGGGVAHHTVWDDQLSLKAQEYLTLLGYNNLVKFHNAEGVRRFTQSITTDPNWIVTLLPLRDGVIMAYKK